MALTPEQKASRLFKKSVGAAETLLARDFFEDIFLNCLLTIIPSINAAIKTNNDTFIFFLTILIYFIIIEYTNIV